jgi:hypothetical protein
MTVRPNEKSRPEPFSLLGSTRILVRLAPSSATSGRPRLGRSHPPPLAGKSHPRRWQAKSFPVMASSPSGTGYGRTYRSCDLCSRWQRPAGGRGDRRGCPHPMRHTGRRRRPSCLQPLSSPVWTSKSRPLNLANREGHDRILWISQTDKDTRGDHAAPREVS